MLENFYSEDLIKTLYLQQHKEHVSPTSLKLRQCIKEIFPTLPWCCIILINLRWATIIYTCFPSFPLLLSHIPCPTATLKIILLVSFWSKYIICFQNCISSFWADYNSFQLLSSTSRSASFAYLYISFFHHVYPCVSSVSHASSELYSLHCIW